jgi:hypothetical protein
MAAMIRSADVSLSMEDGFARLPACVFLDLAQIRSDYVSRKKPGGRAT